MKLDLTRPIRRKETGETVHFVDRTRGGRIMFADEFGALCHLSETSADENFENVPGPFERWLVVNGSMGWPTRELAEQEVARGFPGASILRLTFESDPLVASEVIPVEPAGGKE